MECIWQFDGSCLGCDGGGVCLPAGRCCRTVVLSMNFSWAEMSRGRFIVVAHTLIQPAAPLCFLAGHHHGVSGGRAEQEPERPALELLQPGKCSRMGCVGGWVGRWGRVMFGGHVCLGAILGASVPGPMDSPTERCQTHYSIPHCPPTLAAPPTCPPPLFACRPRRCSC